MSTKLVELRPDVSLINPYFDGYKLSLTRYPILMKPFDHPVDRVLPTSEQYSFLHTKLFGLHNYLFTDYFHDSVVYFVDRTWHVQKISLSYTTGRFNENYKVWKIPHRKDRKPGSYNVSMAFPSKDLAVLSDGTGVLHILQTFSRFENRPWQVVFSDEVLGPDKCFTIQGIILKAEGCPKRELHCLLSYIDKDGDSDQFFTLLNWVVITEASATEWNEMSIRVLKGYCDISYCSLDKNCKFLYIASDKPFKFILDSENVIVNEPKVPHNLHQKTYTWTQTIDDITVRFNVPKDSTHSDITVTTTANSILIKYKEVTLLDGVLLLRINPELTTWTITNETILEVCIVKLVSDILWVDLIPNNKQGEQVMNPSLVAEIHSRLAHLCAETEVVPADSGPALSTQQIEECDFDGEDSAVFERLNGETHEVTHRCNLGAHKVLMTKQFESAVPTSLVIRHDVDGIIWTPQEVNGDLHFKHHATLHAFGYVQASKQLRKFSSFSSDLSYSVICDSSRHAYLYRQRRPVTASELRNRRNGLIVGAFAEQQIIELDYDETLGMSCRSEVLYFLAETYALAVKVRYIENT